MPRLMSVSLTEQAVVERRKTVTRRTGWRFLKPGDRLTLCRKVMGRYRVCATTGAVSREPLVRLAEVEVVDVHREQLRDIHMRPADVEAEGFPGWSPREFIDFFCEHMGGARDQEVTRIEWRYIDGEETDRG